MLHGIFVAYTCMDYTIIYNNLIRINSSESKKWRRSLSCTESKTKVTGSQKEQKLRDKLESKCHVCDAYLYVHLAIKSHYLPRRSLSYFRIYNLILQ